jgi:hypothetical protein
MAYTKKLSANTSEPRTSVNKPTRSVAGSLAGMFLAESVCEGNEVEIPSLGITLKRREPEAKELQEA